MHQLGDDKTIRLALLFAVTFALGNVAVLSLPHLLSMSPGSSRYWLLQLEVAAPLQFPLKAIGAIALDPLRQMGAWLALVFLTFLISITRNAFLAGLLNAALAVASGASIYAIASKLPAFSSVTVIGVLLLMILSQVFITALRGFAAVTRSYLNAGRGRTSAAPAAQADNSLIGRPARNGGLRLSIPLDTFLQSEIYTKICLRVRRGQAARQATERLA